MRLLNRIFLSFLAILLVSTVLSTITGAVLLSTAVRSEAISRVELGLEEARTSLERRTEQLACAAEIIAMDLEGEIALPADPDFVLPSLEGFSGLPLSRGFLLLTAEDLRGRGGAFEPAQDAVLCDGPRLLCLFATSETDGEGVLVGTVLNANNRLVIDLQEALFGNDLYGDKPFGTVTIFCGDLRVATTVLGPDGRVAVGTRVSEEVREKVLERGENWLNRAFVVDEWYLSAYEPIRSPRGENIGILYVGVLEKKYTDLRNRYLILLSVMRLPILGLVLLAAFFITRGIVNPLARLAEASGKIARGRFDVSIGPEGGGREIGALSDAFLRMKEALREREKRLTQQNVKLEEANKDYQELLSFVTHELNNSIGSMLLNASILAGEAEETMGPEQREVVAQILRDVERFRDMVRNYLNLSRLEKGTLRYDPVQFDIRSRVVEPVLERLHHWIEHRRFRVEWDWPEEAVVSADPDLMEICYSNFVVNAIKYGAGWIRFSARREADRWILGVANGGTPVPAQKIPLLFRKFSRLVKSDDGAGLGLYLVRKIVERHGGEVWCESDGESGTRFFLSLSASGA